METDLFVKQVKQLRGKEYAFGSPFDRLVFSFSYLLSAPKENWANYLCHLSLVPGLREFWLYSCAYGTDVVAYIDTMFLVLEF